MSEVETTFDIRITMTTETCQIYYMCETVDYFGDIWYWKKVKKLTRQNSTMPLIIVWITEMDKWDINFSILPILYKFEKYFPYLI